MRYRTRRSLPCLGAGLLALCFGSNALAADAPATPAGQPAVASPTKQVAPDLPQGPAGPAALGPAQQASPIDPPKLSGRLGWIALDCWVSFDWAGKPDPPRDTLRVSFILEARERLVYVCDDVRVDTVVTDANEELAELHPGPSQGNPIPRAFFKPTKPADVAEFESLVMLAAPTRPTKKIAGLSGSARLTFAGGPVSRVTFGPFKDILDKPQTLPSLLDATITFSRWPDGRINVSTTHDVMGLIKQGFVTDDQGNVLKIEDDEIVYRPALEHLVRVAIPDNGKIVLDCYSRVSTCRVPFVLKDMPLPSVLSSPGLAQDRPPRGLAN